MAKAGPIVLAILAVCLIPSAYVGLNDLISLRNLHKQTADLVDTADRSLAGGDTVAAVVALRRAQRFEPANPEFERRLLLAECRLSAESPASLTEAGAVALMVRLHVAGLSFKTDVQVAVALGQVKLFRGERESAHAAFRLAVKHYPDSALAQAALGKSHTLRQEPSEAAGAFEKAVALKPKVSEYREALGRALSRQKKWGGAVEAFAQATELNDSGMNRLQLGEAQLKLGNHEAAIESLSRASRTLTDVPGLARARAALGFAYHKAGKLAASAVELEAALQLRQDASGYFNLGAVRHALDQHRLAMIAFQAGLRYDPGNPGAHLQLIRSLVALGQQSEALKIRKRLIKLTAGQPQIQGLVKKANALLGIP